MTNIQFPDGNPTNSTPEVEPYDYGLIAAYFPSTGEIAVSRPALLNTFFTVTPPDIEASTMLVSSISEEVVHFIQHIEGIIHSDEMPIRPPTSLNSPGILFNISDTSAQELLKFSNCIRYAIAETCRQMNYFGELPVNILFTDERIGANYIEVLEESVDKSHSSPGVYEGHEYDSTVHYERYHFESVALTVSNAVMTSYQLDKLGAPFAYTRSY